MLTGNIQWTEGMALAARSGSGFDIPIDAQAEHGGADRGPRPKELTLLSLGACSAMDVLTILRKMQVPFGQFGIALEADTAEEHPKVFTEVRLVYRTEGEGVDRAKVDRAIALSLQRYCGVSAMVSHTARIVAVSEVNGERQSVAF